MGPNYSGSHLLGPLLERMKLSNVRDEQVASSPVAAPRKTLASKLRGLVPKEFRAFVSRHLLPRAVNERLSMHWKTADVRWTDTRAFVIENANEGYVRVNLKGREPEGIVAAGSDYESICEEIVGVASKMTNPENGWRVAEHVHRASQIYSGPCTANFPDVIVNWDPSARITTAIEAGKYGVIRAEAPAYAVPPYYTGNHRGNAFLVAKGPQVASEAVIEGASILDLAPTILAHFGVDVPSHMDGRVQELLK
jgi:predicted AlkP superfamily phosphohydrolase/phosphomutase